MAGLKLDLGARLPNFGDHRVLDEWVNQVTLRGQVVLEERIRLLLNPAPWWCPERWWLRAAAVFITIGTQHPRQP